MVTQVSYYAVQEYMSHVCHLKVTMFGGQVHSSGEIVIRQRYDDSLPHSPLQPFALNLYELAQTALLFVLKVILIFY